jgi:hypothetical protein
MDVELIKIIGLKANPSLYAYYFRNLKEKANEYGYDLVIRGSVAEELDLTATLCVASLDNVEEMIKDFAENHRRDTSVTRTAII